MNTIETTLISHIYNEEYLLPFWLNHHKNMFDNILIVDYRSTDRSMEICKKICPHCKIINTINPNFDALKVDEEIMELEKEINGIKIVLNVTEFLFCDKEKKIKELFLNQDTNKCYQIDVYSPYSLNNININNNDELLYNLLNEDLLFHKDRFIRIIHNFTSGNYTIGRHSSNHPTSYTNELHIIWLGYFPMNDKLMKRKLQIQSQMSDFDKQNGRGFQHLYSCERIIEINNEKANTGMLLKNINLPLYNILIDKIMNIKL